jgi:hypothetical protein
VEKIKVVSSTRTIEVEWQDGKKVVYEIKCGNKAVLQAYTDGLKDMDKKLSNLKTSSSIEEAYMLFEELISKIDEKIWKDIKKRSKDDLKILVQVVAKIFEELKLGFEDVTKAV